MSRKVWIIVVLLCVIGFLTGVLISSNVFPFFSSINTPDLKGHDYRYILNGTSMLPTLAEGTIVYVDVIANMSHINIDDIIAFHTPYNWDTVIIHRVVERTETTEGIIIRTKGDATPIRDPWQLQEEYVIGKVVEYQ